MSVFAEPLAQVEDALVYLEAITLSLGPGERTTKLASARAALDLIEQRATDMEKALRKRRKAGHNDTCDFVKAFDPPLPCSCGHDEMCAALSAREEAQT